MTSWPNIGKGLRKGMRITPRPSGRRMQWAAPFHWRVYGDGREYGRDYPTLESARDARARYSEYYPHVRYVIRRHRGPASAV